jgi:hypothetical protein
MQLSADLFELLPFTAGVIALFLRRSGVSPSFLGLGIGFHRERAQRIRTAWIAAAQRGNA